MSVDVNFLAVLANSGQCPYLCAIWITWFSPPLTLPLIFTMNPARLIFVVVSLFSYVDKPLKLGDHGGNHFTIVLRYDSPHTSLPMPFVLLFFFVSIPIDFLFFSFFFFTSFWCRRYLASLFLINSRVCLIGWCVGVWKDLTLTSIPPWLRWETSVSSTTLACSVLAPLPSPLILWVGKYKLERMPQMERCKGKKPCALAVFSSFPPLPASLCLSLSLSLSLSLPLSLPLSHTPCPCRYFDPCPFPLFLSPFHPLPCTPHGMISCV